MAQAFRHNTSYGTAPSPTRIVHYRDATGPTKKKAENTAKPPPTPADIATAVLSGMDKSNRSRAERIARLKAGIKALEEVEPLKTNDPDL